MTLKKIIILFFFSNILSQCESHETEIDKGSQKNNRIKAPSANEHSAQSLIGKWELRKRTGGYGGGSATYTKGNGSVLNFTTTNFESYQNGKLIESGVYKIYKDSASFNKVYTRLLYIKKSYLFKHFESFENDQLLIWEDADDGSSYYYDQLK